MGFNASSGLVGIASGYPVPLAGQTLVNIPWVGAGATADAYTVPANKIFYLFGIFVAHSANCQITIMLNDAATYVLDCRVLANSQGPVMSPVPLATYTAGQIIKAAGTVGAKVQIVGVLVDA